MVGTRGSFRIVYKCGRLGNRADGSNETWIFKMSPRMPHIKLKVSTVRFIEQGVSPLLWFVTVGGDVVSFPYLH